MMPTVGQRAETRRVITDAAVSAFAEVTGDTNPLHLDDAVAAAGRFGRRVAHGMLGAGFISATLGTILPGPGAIYLSQSLRFRAPAYPGDTVVVCVEIIAVRQDKPIVTVATVVRNERGDLLIEGEATLLLPES